jgi:hypothetical protein
MRLALVSLIAVASAAVPALAQMESPSGSPSQPMPMNSPPTSAQPAPPVNGAAPSVATPAAPEAPTPPPPGPPTDPTAIALLNVLQTVCVPAANGGDLAKLAKSAGFRTNNDNFVLKHPGYQFTILAPGSNPNQCHVDVIHPIDPEAPGKPVVEALHNWAVYDNGWTLYRNDKNVSGNQELTTRSWEHDSGGKHEALVIITFRHADDTPSQRSADTSSVIYSVTPIAG